MMKITDSAIKQFKKILDEQHPRQGGIRIGARGNGDCALTYYIGLQTEALKNDISFRIGEVDFFMDQLSKEKLESIEIDYLENPFKTGFIFREVDTGKKRDTTGCVFR